MAGWAWVMWLNFITAASYVGIATIIVRGLARTHQLTANKLALATATIFLTCAAHHVLHALDLVDGSRTNVQMMREMMGDWWDVAVTASTAITGVIYLGLRRSYGMLLRSPAMFDHAAEVRYRQLAANLPHTAVFVVDADLRFQLAAGQELADAGYRPETFEGRLLREVLPPDLLVQFEPHYRAAVSGDEAEFDSVSAITGKVYHNRARPLLDESGKVSGGLVLAEDVTAERAAQEELARAKAFSEAVLAASPDITVISDLAHGELKWSSRDLFELLGWGPGDPTPAAKPSLSTMVFPEDQPRIVAANAAIGQLADGESITTRYRVRAADGYRWLSRQSTPFGRDADGVPRDTLSVIRDVTEVVEVERRMEHAALHDPLTGLPNRALLLDRMTSALARADRLHAEVAVMFLDLDGFKKVNDTDGHAAGDAVLVEVARRLQQVLRKSDSVARVGGDEFVVILEPQAPVETADTADQDELHSEPQAGAPLDLRAVADLVSNRIRVELGEPVDHLGRPYVVSVSIGLTFAARGSRAADVLRDADTALYRAKQKGKNRVEVYDESLGADVVERIRVEGVLRQALTPGIIRPPILSVAYQPIYDLGSRRLVGFEALARLVDAGGRPIPPDLFIPIAEETGIITGLGERVLDEALAALARWRHGNDDRRAATMSVNLSARQAQHVDMPEVALAALARHRLQPADLVLELTESVLLESGSSTLRQLSELRESGVGIAIDDFGTGYASLRYLATLPVSSVKVDRSFTATVTANPVSATIVRAIVTLAADLDLDCVVEGIETAEQFDALPGGVLGQGYLLGRPAAEPADHWPAFAPDTADGPGVQHRGALVAGS